MRLAALAVIVVALATPATAEQVRLANDCQGGDQQACAQLARTGQELEVRLAAVRRLTDQNLLADIARTEKNGRVRVAAIRALINQEALSRIAHGSRNAVDRGAAVERLHDQAVVADIARHDSSKWVRRKAASCLTDEQLVARLVAEDRHELFPTLTVTGGLKHVTVDGKDIKETLLGSATLLPGRHTLRADFTVREAVAWEPESVNSTEITARLGIDYTLEAEVQSVHWDFVAPGTRQGRGTWKLLVREEVSPGPNLVPLLLRR